MFTGIIEEVGHIQGIEQRGSGARICISASKTLEGTVVGDSISSNGMCLTVSELGADRFFADVMPETISRTSFAGLRTGAAVNLERALAVGGRLGGHIVTGHIDGVGSIASIVQDSDAVRISVRASDRIASGIVEKGSVALEGISLTVTEARADGFGASLIPHTFANTNLASKRVGDAVNIEDDILGKYVFRALARDGSSGKMDASGGITEAMLAECGF